MERVTRAFNCRVGAAVPARRPDLRTHSASRIGHEWRAEDHAFLVRILAEVDRLAEMAVETAHHDNVPRPVAQTTRRFPQASGRTVWRWANAAREAAPESSSTQTT